VNEFIVNSGLLKLPQPSCETARELDYVKGSTWAMSYTTVSGLQHQAVLFREKFLLVGFVDTGLS